MSQRYIELFKGPNNLYLKGAPIIISAHVLLKDSEKNKILAQMKFCNISNKKILAVKVIIKCRDIKGNDIEDSVEYTYLDLNFSRGEYSGDRIPIYLENESTRFYTVGIKEIIFEDKTSWTCNEPADKWKEISSNLPIEEVIPNKKLLNLYASKFSITPVIKPSEFEDLWFCSCGFINHNNEDTCFRCKNKKDDIFTYANEKLLKQECTELYKKRNSTIKKIFIPLIIFVIVLFSAFFTYSWLTRPLPVNYSFDDIKLYIENNSDINLIDYASDEARKFNDCSYVDDFKEFYFLEKNEISIGTLRRSDQDIIINIELDWNKEPANVNLDTNINCFDIYIYENLSFINSTIFIDADFDDDLENYSQKQLENDLNMYDESLCKLLTAIDKDIFNSLNEAIEFEKSPERDTDELKSDGFDNYQNNATRLKLYPHEDGYWFEKHIETPSVLSTSYTIDNSEEYSKIQEKIEDDEKKEQEQQDKENKQEENDVDSSENSTNGTWSGGHWNIYTGGWSG